MRPARRRPQGAAAGAGQLTSEESQDAAPDAVEPDERLFNAPASRSRMESLLLRLQVQEGGRVLDVGCGRGTMLAWLAATTGCAGVGVDPDEEALAVARGREAGAGQLEWIAAKMEDVRPAALAGPGSTSGSGFEAALCVGSSHAFGGRGEALDATLVALQGLVHPGGRLLLGEGFWRQDPPAGYIEATGFEVGDLLTHAENQAAAARHGWTLLHAEVSSAEEWDAFETGFLLRAQQAHAAAPDDDKARAALEHWTGWNAAYRRWGRDTLGFGFYVLERSR